MKHQQLCLALLVGFSSAYPTFTQENYEVGVDPFFKSRTILDSTISETDYLINDLSIFNSCNECVVNGRIYAQMNIYPPFYKTNIDFEDEDPDTDLNPIWLPVGTPSDIQHNCISLDEFESSFPTAYDAAGSPE